MDGAEDVLSRFARAIIDNDMTAAHGLLAPWLQRAVTPDELRAVFERGAVPGAPPPARVLELGVSSAVDWTSLTDADGPRASLASFARGAELDPEVGMLGPPCFAFDPALSDETFRGWGGLDLAPAEDDDSGLDYALRLYVAVAEVDGRLCVGHVEPEIA